MANYAKPRGKKGKWPEKQAPAKRAIIDRHCTINLSPVYISSFSVAVCFGFCPVQSFAETNLLSYFILKEQTVHKLKRRKIKLPPNCLSGRASHPLGQPHRRTVYEEPCQCPASPLSPVSSGTTEAKLRFTENYLPLSLLPELPTQVPPPPELQWYLPHVIQLYTSRHENLLQNQERWVTKLTSHWVAIQDEHLEEWLLKPQSWIDYNKLFTNSYITSSKEVDEKECVVVKRADQYSCYFVLKAESRRGSKAQ